MIYLLLIVLITLFFLSYLLSGKDLFAPATVQILTFTGSAFLCVYFMFSMDAPHTFHWDTILMIMCAMALSMTIGAVIHWIYSRVEITPYDEESISISPISGFVNCFIIGVVSVTIVWLLTEVRHIAGSSNSFFDMMHSYRMTSSYSTDSDSQLPWLLRQLYSLIRILLLVYTFNIIRFYKELSFSQRIMNVFIIILCGLGLLLNGARNKLIIQLIAGLIMFHLLRIQKESGYKKYDFKVIIKIMTVFVMILVMFYITKSFVGRNSRNEKMNAVDYISYYTGTEYIMLDDYMQHPPAASDIFGKETFYFLNQFMATHGLSDSPLYIRHLEFRNVGAGYRSNTYTFLRAYHHDFGMPGVFILHGISMIFMSVFYESVKKRRGTLSILIFSELYYCIVLSFFQEYAFAEVFSVSFIKMIIMLLALYEVLFRKGFRVVFQIEGIRPNAKTTEQNRKWIAGAFYGRKNNKSRNHRRKTVDARKKHRKEKEKKWIIALVGVVFVLSVPAGTGYSVFHHYFGLMGRLDEIPAPDVANKPVVSNTSEPDDQEPPVEPEDEPSLPPASEEEVSKIEAELQKNLENMEAASELYSSEAFNILLIGVDSRSDSMSGQSDAMILVSINKRTKQVTMTSFLRDIYLSIPGYGSNRLNVSYAYGGTELLKETIKANFGIPIDRCVVVNFYLVMDMVDAVGGIDLELSEDEIDVMNRLYISHHNRLLGNPEGTDILSAGDAGTVHVNGNQALAYARVRYVGTDFARTGRQRTVITKCLEKIKGMGLGKINGLAEEFLPRIRTDLDKGDCAAMLLMALDLGSYDFTSLTIPTDGTWRNANINGMSVLTVDFTANTEAWYNIVEGTENE